jgi:hypothetical protein
MDALLSKETACGGAVDRAARRRHWLGLIVARQRMRVMTAGNRPGSGSPLDNSTLVAILKKPVGQGTA